MILTALESFLVSGVMLLSVIGIAGLSSSTCPQWVFDVALGGAMVSLGILVSVRPR